MADRLAIEDLPPRTLLGSETNRLRSWLRADLNDKLAFG